MKVYSLLTTLLVLNLGIFASMAEAAEALRFDSSIPRSSFESIKHFSNNALDKSISGIDIAEADLNQDGLSEFILRSKSCKTLPVCRFDILAETDEGIVSLGTIQGKNLLLGNEFTHGVRNILLFEEAMNDFDYELYTWHPELSSYGKDQP